MGSIISKTIIYLDNQTDNQIDNQTDNQDKTIYNNNKLEIPLSEIVCIKTFNNLQKEYLYCYVCKLEKKIITECSNCNLINIGSYYEYNNHNNYQYLLNDKSNLVCHKCFYLHSDDYKVSNIV